MNYLNDFEKFLKLMTSNAGQIIKKHFRSNLTIELKIDQSPVTIVDKEVELMLRSMIQGYYPDHGIIAEEFDDYQPNADYVWILDPIDGTTSFICGSVNFGTLIALTYKKKPVLGVFYHPILDQFMIGDGTVTKLNDEIVTVPKTTNLNQARLLTTNVFNIKKYQNIKNFENLVNQVGYFRGIGDCYGYYLLASGFAEIMIDPVLSIWDMAAIIPIIQGAGGIITDFKGGDPFQNNNLIACSPNLHKDVINILNKKIDNTLNEF